MANELGILSERPGWTVNGSMAIYRPSADGWGAKVFPLQRPGRSSYSRFHICVADPSGVARFTFQAVSVGEAIRLAEGRVRGCG